MPKKNRETLLGELNDARWRHDAKEIVQIMQSRYIYLFTPEDIEYLYVNTLCRQKDAKFAQDLQDLNAIAVFHRAFPGWTQKQQ